MAEPIRFPTHRHLPRRSAREIALLNAIIARDERIAALEERLADAEAARDIALQERDRARESLDRMRAEDRHSRAVYVRLVRILSVAVEALAWYAERAGGRVAREAIAGIREMGKEGDI